MRIEYHTEMNWNNYPSNTKQEDKSGWPLLRIVHAVIVLFLHSLLISFIACYLIWCTCIFRQSLELLIDCPNVNVQLDSPVYTINHEKYHPCCFYVIPHHYHKWSNSCRLDEESNLIRESDLDQQVKKKQAANYHGTSPNTQATTKFFATPH